MALSGEVTCVWPLAAELGEGPLWSPHDRAVWFTDIKQSRIHCFDPATGAGKSWEAPSPPGFLALLGPHRFIVGAKTGLYDFDTQTGAFTLITTVEPGLPANRLNDGAVDGRGRLWFGSMDDAEIAQRGTLYRFDRNGLQAMDDGYFIPNGPAFNPDGKTLYHTETLKKTIYAFDAGDDGTLSNKRVFVRIEEGAGYPDGLTIDAEGCLWTGLFGGGAVRRYSPRGEHIVSVAFPCSNVTKIAFGGEDLCTAYATTAWKDIGPDRRRAQPLAGGLFRFRVETPGLPQIAVDYG